MIFSGKTQKRKITFRVIFLTIIFGLLLMVADFIFGVFAAARDTANADLKYYQNIVGDKKIIALTFDDGPNPVKTEQIMEVLQRNNVPATFFFMGSHALEYPDLVRKAYDAGFEIGNHTFTHSLNVHSSQQRLRFELNLTNRIIEGITGESTLLYRPPYLLDVGGDPTIDPDTPLAPLSWVSDAGYVVVGADLDTLDWKANSPEEIVSNLKTDLQFGGHIALLHDGGSGQYTVEALQPLIDMLRADGYEFVTASAALAINATAELRVTKDLALGLTDAETDGEISMLQTLLFKDGVYEGDITGVFDDGTRQGLTAWQEKHQIQNEAGFVGSTTREAIKEEIQGTTVSKPRQATFIEKMPFSQNVQRAVVNVASFINRAIMLIVKILLVLAFARLFFILSLRSTHIPQHMPKITPPKKGVSVIVPIFNEAHNIRSTLYSILQSNYQPKEIVVVDDGSTDNSAEIAAEIAALQPETIRLFRKENNGKAQALNFGITKAKYAVVITMDGDTIFHKNAIEKLVRHFYDPRVGAVAGRVRTVKPSRIMHLFQHLEYIISQHVDKLAFNKINSVNIVPGPIGAWRKKTLIAAGGFKTDTLVEDQDMTMAMHVKRQRIVYEPDAIAFTETPHTIRDFIKQRFRWIFGTIQCLWKYKKHFFNFRKPTLGWAILPDTFLFTICVPLMYPIMDILFITSLAFGAWQKVIFMYAAFIGIDLMYAAIGFWHEHERRGLIFLLPFQRLFYRFVLYIVVIRSLIKAIEGTEAKWNKVKKRGDAQAFHLSSLEKKPHDISA